MSFWNWAVRAYAAPEVEALCLELQDRDGQSVCLLLWAGWAALSGRAPGSEAIIAAAGLARAWETGVIGPLRAARRGLETAPSLAGAERASLKSQVQAAELAAERALMGALEALTGVDDGERADPAALMARASNAWGQAAPFEALRALSSAFPRG